MESVVKLLSIFAFVALISGRKFDSVFGAQMQASNFQHRPQPISSSYVPPQMMPMVKNTNQNMFFAHQQMQRQQPQMPQQLSQQQHKTNVDGIQTLSATQPNFINVLKSASESNSQEAPILMLIDPKYSNTLMEMFRGLNMESMTKLTNLMPTSNIKKSQPLKINLKSSHDTNKSPQMQKMALQMKIENMKPTIRDFTAPSIMQTFNQPQASKNGQTVNQPSQLYNAPVEQRNEETINRPSQLYNAPVEQRNEETINQHSQLFNAPVQKMNEETINQSSQLFDAPVEQRNEKTVNQPSQVYTAPIEQRNEETLNQPSQLYNAPVEQRNEETINQPSQLYNTPVEQRNEETINQPSQLYNVPVDQRNEETINQLSQLYNAPIEQRNEKPVNQPSQVYTAPIEQRNEETVNKPSQMYNAPFEQRNEQIINQPSQLYNAPAVQKHELLVNQQALNNFNFQKHNQNFGQQAVNQRDSSIGMVKDTAKEARKQIDQSLFVFSKNNGKDKPMTMERENSRASSIQDIIAQNENIASASNVDVNTPNAILVPEHITQMSNFTFSCTDRQPGFYADVDFNCQFFHRCLEGTRRYTFMCSPGTVFNQEQINCDFEDAIECSIATQFFDDDQTAFL